MISEIKRLKKLLLEDLIEILEKDFYDAEKSAFYESIILSDYKDLCSRYEKFIDNGRSLELGDVMYPAAANAAW